MMDIPTKATVHCVDGVVGLSTYVIANPINHQITHLVVKSIRPSFRETLVPVTFVAETTPDLIELNCTRDELDKMEPFEVEEYVRTEVPNYLNWAYVVTTAGYIPVDPDLPDETVEYVPVTHRNIAPEEIAVQRGARVEATDGYVGQVDELLVNSKNMQVSHLVLNHRHIFEQREITIPVSQIDFFIENTIYLKLDKKGVAELPTTPVKRWEQEDMGKGQISKA
jgi:hypothetical protein